MAFLDVFPVSKGHSLLIPKKHYVNLFDVDPDVAAHMARRLLELTRGVKNATGEEGIMIVVANGAGALFKQTAFFLALPLIAYLLRKPPVDDPVVTDDGLKPPGNGLDLRGFAKIAIQVLIFVIAVSLPFLSDISNYIFYIFQRPGGVLYTDVSVLPNASQPITITVLLISVNIIIQNLNASLGVAIPEIPESIIQIVNLGNYYTVFLVLTMIPLLLLMLIHVKDDRNLRQYWSKMLFLTLLLMICLHLFSPRGIYKYYCVALIPFFT
ncbi:unnamed protein product, partial [marine sediment metagenome]